MPDNKISEMQLAGYGSLEWDQVKALLKGFKCAFADYEGFHVGEDCPAEAPDYTHLWAWKILGQENGSEARVILARVRIDAGKGILGILAQRKEDISAVSSGMNDTEKPETETKKPEAKAMQPVTVTVTIGEPWGVDEKRIGKRYDKDIIETKFAMIQPSLLLTASFICPESSLSPQMALAE